MWILQCWLLPSITQWHDADCAGGRPNVGRLDKEIWTSRTEKGTCIWKKPAREEMENVFFRKRFMPQFSRFWRTLSLLSSFGFSVWTGMDGCVWRSLNVFGLMVWREKPSLSVADKHVLPAACSQRLQIHLVHCVFFTIKVHWVASESWVLNRCPVNKVKDLQVVVWREGSGIVCTSEGIPVSVHTTSQK